jgi:hypothetical protein
MARLAGVEHISDHDLERYYLVMAADDSKELAAIEEHLLWCEDRQQRYSATEDYVNLLRLALLRTNDKVL